jgi:hypothetical protein
VEVVFTERREGTGNDGHPSHPDLIAVRSECKQLAQEASQIHPVAHGELLLRSLLILVSLLLLAMVHLHRDVGRYRATCFTPVEMNNVELNVPVKLNTPNLTKN